MKGDAAFWALLVGEATIVALALLTKVAYLWYNAIGAIVVVLFGVLFSRAGRWERTDTTA